MRKFKTTVATIIFLVALIALVSVITRKKPHPTREHIHEEYEDYGEGVYKSILNNQ